MSKKGITIYIKFTSLIFCLISNSYGFSGKNCKKKDHGGSRYKKEDVSNILHNWRKDMFR